MSNFLVCVNVEWKPFLKEAWLGTSHTYAHEGNDEKIRVGQDAFQQALKHHPNVRRLQTFTEPRWMAFSRELLAPLLDAPGVENSCVCFF